MGIIHYLKKDDVKFTLLQSGIERAEMLPGRVDGVHTYKCRVKAGQDVELETFSETTTLYYFTRGQGYVTTATKAFNVVEPSLFVPELTPAKQHLHAVTDMEFLQLTCEMLPEDKELWSHWHIKLPYFLPVSNCIEYTEGFRPEAIHAYSILDRHWVTRMTMGAVIGQGPNKADPHQHDNLYQWYYGMPGTKFIYTAGDEHITLSDGDFAFIPTHVQHAIEIEPGENVNYVWFEIEVPQQNLGK